MLYNNSMFEKLLNKQSFNENDIAFVVKNKRLAPKELLVRMGLESGDTPVATEAPVVEEEVATEAPKRTRRSK